MKDNNLLINDKDNEMKKGKEENTDEKEKTFPPKKEVEEIEENNIDEKQQKLLLKNEIEEEDDQNIIENSPLYRNEEKEEETENNENQNKFTCVQKISLIIFGSGFIGVIIGVLLLDWWFVQMASLFIVLSIILIFLLRKGEKKGIQAFMKGAGDFCGVAIIIGIARGINITLDDGKISDTIIYHLSNLISGLPRTYFAILMLFIFIILGFFIQSSSGLAVLSMPVFAPLADKVGCNRNVIVNAFMFGQNFIGLIAPTGISLIILQMVGIKFNHWIKFIWPIMTIIFVYLLALIIINASFI